MALKEIKYNNTTIYIDDEISDEEKGFALNKKNVLEETQVLNLKDDLVSTIKRYSNVEIIDLTNNK